MLESNENSLQKAAVSSLEKIGTVEAVAGLIKASESSDAFVRKISLKALERIDKTNHLPVEILVRAKPSGSIQLIKSRSGKDNSETYIEIPDSFKIDISSLESSRPSLLSKKRN